MSARTSKMSSTSSAVSAGARVAAYGWQALKGDLDTYGCAVLPKLLAPGECRAIAALYADESHFRSHIHMARHGFGKGEYRYFKYPLPDLLGSLRTALYPHLLASPTNGTDGWELATAIPTTTRRSSGDVTTPARCDQRHYCCSMSRATSTVSTRTFMAISHSRSRSRFSSLNPERTSPAVSSSSRSSGRACKAAPKSCRFGRVMLWHSQFITARSKARRVIIASIFVTV